MTTYNLTVKIDDLILQSGSKDSLCIAKRVNGHYNVIFQNASPVPIGKQKMLIGNNEFSWQDKYQVFLTTNYGVGALVQQSTNPVDIKFGQSSLFKDSQLEAAVTADTSEWDTGSGSGQDSTFAVESCPASLHTGVRASTGGGDWSTIYVDPDVHMTTSRIELTPQNQYIIFWKKITTTEAIIAISTSKGFEWNFPQGKTAKTLRFGFAVPNKQSSQLEEAKWYEM
ncbi:hypothetical protein BKA66DRAFT_437186 [Pyrenochaeta sp. MPI-SDFR-AT-0127]|nr:hypothetical protein BKA66DRAFT_437186 [Pyrenochaeta sp. MPI-SDFR-AT-0127]